MKLMTWIVVKLALPVALLEALITAVLLLLLSECSV